MAKVIQVRGLSDEAHQALVRAAQTQGMSVSRFVRRELELVARRAQMAQHNTDIVRAAQATVGAAVDRAPIIEALTADRRR